MDDVTQARIEYARALYYTSLAIKKNPLKFFEPQPYQRILYTTDKRNINIFGGNRSGKTVNGACYVLQHLLDNPNSDWWACTWADLSIPVQQREIYKWLPKDKSLISYAQYSEQRGFSNRMIKLTNGSILRFKTYDQGRESFQGTSKDGIWNDEEAPEDIIKEERARLIDRNGIMLRTMTPLNGLTYTYDEVVLNKKKNKDVFYEFWKTTDNRKLDEDVVSNIMSQYSDKEADVRRNGKFINLTSGLIYYPFSVEKFGNVVTETPFTNKMEPIIASLPVELSCDFNVDYMYWSIGQEYNGVDYEFDYICLDSERDIVNTPDMCDLFKQKYPDWRKYKLKFYCDIYGKHENTVTSLTDFSVIENAFPDAEIHYQKIKNVKDRVMSLNARLCNANKERRLFVNETCVDLINDLTRNTWELFFSPSERSKNYKLTHPTDGLSYKTFWKYPQNYSINDLSIRRM